MILIYPPVARANEPPLGVSFLASSLSEGGIKTRILDLNLEGQLWLMAQNKNLAEDSWTRGAVKRRESNLDYIRTQMPTENTDRYRRALTDLNRLLAVSGKPKNLTLSLTDFEDQKLNPLLVSDLLYSAKNFTDNIFYPLFESRIQQLTDKNDLVFGISLNFISQALCSFSIAGYIKKTWPNAAVYLGGSLVTSWVRLKLIIDETMFPGLFDKIIGGPGEAELGKLLGVESKRGAPDYSDLPLDSYLSPGRVIPYSFSIGCAWKKCVFCPELTEGSAFAREKTQASIQTIHKLVEKYNPALLHFTDSEVSLADLRALIQNPPGVPWYGFARFSESLDDPDFCFSLADSGCVMLQLGLESGSQEVLDQMGKGTNVRLIRNVLQNLKQANIMTYVYLLFGTPAEDVTKALQTVTLLVEQSANIDFMNLAIFNMPRFSAEANLYGTGQYYEGELGLYTGFEHPKGWNRRNVREFIDKAVLGNTELCKIDRKQPGFYTSSHAPFYHSFFLEKISSTWKS